MPPGVSQSLAPSPGPYSRVPPKKRSSLACVRCRRRHIKCPGDDPCKKCVLAKVPCEYVEADKKIVVSMRYLQKLHDDIAKLKKENATLRNSVKEGLNMSGEAENDFNTGDTSSADVLDNDLNSSEHSNDMYMATNDYMEMENNAYASLDDSSSNPQSNQNIFNTLIDHTEIIQPFLDKSGRLIHSRTGEKLYVGSSSMTLLGLEIQNLIPTQIAQNSHRQIDNDSIINNGYHGIQSICEDYAGETILEREGDAYRIMLGKTRSRPSIAVNFTLPSYSYAMLLIDTFIGYNDGCFYFFNEGLIKENLKKVYDDDDNSILKSSVDSTLQTIWFCKLLLIFAVGEMYLGTANKRNGNKRKASDMIATLPGSGFFHQASELFTGLFASGAIDNCARDGGIEVMLLYAFYLQVADCTVASYFYFGLALRASLILGWHVDAGNESLNRYELEHRRRLWWTVYMYERMLSSKAGLPLSFTDDSISTGLPVDFDMSNPPAGCEHFIFPEAEYITNCVKITQINAKILSKLYTKQPNSNILPVVSDLVNQLLCWRQNIPEFLKVDYTAKNLQISRLIVNMNTEYFQGMNLAVRPLLFHFATKQLKQVLISENKYIDLSKYSKSILTLLNSSFQASINTVRSIWALLPENMVALFGWMDREYLFTSASTLILFNAAFGVHDATREHLDHALAIFTKMRNLGNHPAALRRAQLLKLISVLDFNGVMKELLLKHDDNVRNVPFNRIPTSTSTSTDEVSFPSPSNSTPVGLNSYLNATYSKFISRPLRRQMNESSSRSTLSQKPINDNLNKNQDSEMGGSTAIDQVEPQSGLSPFTNQEKLKANTISPESLNINVKGEEQELWNEISNKAMWLGDASEEFQSLMVDFT